jgi:hypothetical protein
MRTADQSPSHATPVGRLIGALGLLVRRTAVVQDMYSRPIARTPAVRRLVPRRQPVRTPDLAA